MAPLRLLFVYAHVADAACEASGTMALHVDRGDEVDVLITSDGERHHAAMFLSPDESPGRGDIPFVRASMDEACAIKRREADRALAIIGTHSPMFLGWPDEHEPLGLRHDREIAEVILRLRPDMVVSHLPHHTYGPAVDAHSSVGSSVARAIELAGSRISQLDGERAHWVRERMWFPQGELADSRDLLNPGIVADVWVDITPVIERKVQAIDQIVSQSYQGRTARKLVESREGRWGMLSGCSYAEPFVRGGRTYPALPMPPMQSEDHIPNDLPGDQVIAIDVPSAVPADAYEVPG